MNHPMNILRTLWQLGKAVGNVKASPAQLKEERQAKLRTLLHHAFSHSAYYRNAFGQRGIAEEDLDKISLHELPVLDKQTLLHRFDEIVTVPGLTQEALRAFDENQKVDRRPYLGKYHVIHSSGSTGKPGYFVYDEAAWSDVLVGIVRAALWGMSMPGILGFLALRPRIAFVAATDGRYAGAMAVGDGIQGVGASMLSLDVKTPLDSWAEQLNTFRPNMIIGYPSAIKLLSGLVQSGRVSLRVKRVVTCGEPLDMMMRRHLEAVFHAQVINFYGCSESLALGVEHDPAQGMLLFEDMNIIEADEEGVYVTCLYNLAQPLIRYKLTDRLILSPTCDAVPFSRAKGLLGRCGDVMWFSNGEGVKEFLHPLSIEGFCVEGLMDYQFRQTAQDAFDMLAEASAGADQAYIEQTLRRQMNAILHEKGLSYVDFRVRFVQSIPADTRTGKKPLILSSRPDRVAYGT